MIKVTTYNGMGWPVESAYKKFKFPAGELNVTVQIKKGDQANILFQFETCEEIVELLLIVDAIKRAGGILNTLKIPYFPFALLPR